MSGVPSLLDRHFVGSPARTVRGGRFWRFPQCNVRGCLPYLRRWGAVGSVLARSAQRPSLEMLGRNRARPLALSFPKYWPTEYRKHSVSRRSAYPPSSPNHLVHGYVTQRRIMVLKILKLMIASVGHRATGKLVVGFWQPEVMARHHDEPNSGSRHAAGVIHPRA